MRYVLVAQPDLSLVANEDHIVVEPDYAAAG